MSSLNRRKVIPLTRIELAESSAQLVRDAVEHGNPLVGYVYPHVPFELFLAHSVTPSLIRADPSQRGDFEDSLQTFACSLTRNLFSQRMSGTMPLYDGFLFPGNTCDSLQNLADVWRHRFPDDRVYRLTYPATKPDDAAVRYFAEELRNLSYWLETSFGTSFTQDRFEAACAFVSTFRDVLTYLYSARACNPGLVSYSALVGLLGDFLADPSEGTLKGAQDALDSVKAATSSMECSGTVESIRRGLLQGSLDGINLERNSSSKRIVVAGGMVDPRVLSDVVERRNKSERVDIVLDLLSFGFRTVFTHAPSLDGDPFESMARSVLSAPLEPTQEGLSARKLFLQSVLASLSVDGLMVCEQSFCDPDEFEGPSLERVAREMGIPVVRVPLDPELSDSARIETRIQTFLENINLEV